ILISATSPGGTSLYSNADYMSAANAASFINNSGVGQLNAIELRKALTGKNVNISPFISERTEGISGSSDKEGLQTAVEMISGFCSAPRLDEDMSQSLLSRTLSSLENRENDSQFVLSEQIALSLYGDNIRRTPASAEQMKAIDRARALEIYKER